MARYTDRLINEHAYFSSVATEYCTACNALKYSVSNKHNTNPQSAFILSGL